MTPKPMKKRAACFHGRHWPERYGQHVTVLAMSPRGSRPRNALIEFLDGEKVVTSIGCLRWKCERHEVKDRITRL